MNRAYLVQILVPKETGRGEPVSKEWFEELLQELTDKFGGATSFIRSPGQGLWRNGDRTERDEVAVVEVMAATLAPEFWRSLRERLEREIAQENRHPRPGNHSSLILDLPRGPRVVRPLMKGNFR